MRLVRVCVCGFVCLNSVCADAYACAWSNVRACMCACTCGEHRCVRVYLWCVRVCVCVCVCVRASVRA